MCQQTGEFFRADAVEAVGNREGGEGLKNGFAVETKACQLVFEQAYRAVSQEVPAEMDFLQRRAKSAILAEFLITHACATRTASGHRKKAADTGDDHAQRTNE